MHVHSWQAQAPGRAHTRLDNDRGEGGKRARETKLRLSVFCLLEKKTLPLVLNKDS